jgi:hypothetical protein
MKANIETVLNGINGCTFAGITTVTSVTLTGGKGNPMKGQVFKNMEGANVMIGANYAAMVKRKLVLENKDPEEFTSGALPWGTRIGDTPLIHHKGNVYIQLVFKTSGAISYQFEGKPIEIADITGFPVRKVSDHSQGGLEDKVEIRTINIQNIAEIKINGQTIIELTHPLQGVDFLDENGKPVIV